MVVGVGRQVVSARTASQLHPTARPAGSARDVVTAGPAGNVCAVVTARADGPGCRFGASRHHLHHRRVWAAPRGDDRALRIALLQFRRRGGAPGASRTRAAGVSDRLRLRRATGPRRPQCRRDKHEARTSRSSVCSGRAIHSGRARAPQADEAIGTGSAWRSRGRRARSVRRGRRHPRRRRHPLHGQSSPVRLSRRGTHSRPWVAREPGPAQLPGPGDTPPMRPRASRPRRHRLRAIPDTRPERSSGTRSSGSWWSVGWWCSWSGLADGARRARAGAVPGTRHSTSSVLAP